MVVEAYRLTPDDAMITDYFVVGEATTFLGEDDETCEIFLAFRNGHCRLTTALGMFKLGRDRLLQLWGQYRDTDREGDDE